MDKRKLGNLSQIRFAKEITIDGKHCILAQNGELEVLFNKDNALDVVWVKYRGVNISFLSKNGLNDGARDFTGNFEGGFLYTCGMDNISGCVSGKPVHGSLHYKKCDTAYAYIEGENITVCGEVRECALFGKNLLLKRVYTLTDSSLQICDSVANIDYKDTEYILLYHINYGYPFLDECLQMEIPATNSAPLTEIAAARKDEMFKITPPVDGGDEDVYYHTLSEGKIRLTNPEKGITVEMEYDVTDFPVTLEWKSMIGGDYALGIEPSLSRFDNFKMKALPANASKTYKIKINFQ